MINGNDFDELIDILKARPAGTASGPLDKNKYVAKKVPVQRDGQTVMVTKYFDPSQSKDKPASKTGDKKESGNSGVGGSNNQGMVTPPAIAQYKTGYLVKIISDQIGAVVQTVTKDSKKNQFVLSVVTEKGNDIEVYEKDVEKVTSNEESQKITRDSIVNGLRTECDSINKETQFSEKKKILTSTLKAAKNGITNVLVYGDSSVGKNKTILSILSSAGVKKNSISQKLDKTLSLSELDLSKIKNEDDLKEFLEKNSKSLIFVYDKDNKLPDYKKVFKDAIDRTLVSIEFNGYFIFSVNVDISGVPEEIKTYCLCVDMNMTEEIKKSFLLVELSDIDCTDENEKFDLIKSFFIEEEIIEKSAQMEIPTDCILIDYDEYARISDKQISDSVFEELNIGDKKVYKIKII
jgi:hypothetical protein